jgi:hypothetical protein
MVLRPKPHHTMPTRKEIERALKLIAQKSGFGSHIDLQQMQLLGYGMHRVAFHIKLKVQPDPANLSGEHVILYPYDEEALGIKERLKREAKTLQLLAQVNPIFRFPKLIDSIEINDSVILYERFVEGVPLDLRVGRCLVGHPWEVVGEIAARVHDLRELSEHLDGFKTRREQALYDIEVLKRLGESTFERAYEWCLRHLPPEGEPTTLLHGDLSGQNILVHPEGLIAPALIDWTFAVQGDPAHEMAIVTQGHRRPFEVDYGHERLLESYHDAGGTKIELHEVFLYELCLFGRRFEAANKNKFRRTEDPNEPLRLAYNLLMKLKKKFK